MNRVEPKYRRPLNDEQVEILELLYKFRFVTKATLKEYFAETKPGMNVFRKLERLEEQGLIAKRYFPDYKLLHKPVAYYLLPVGARKLAGYRDEDDTDEINIKAIYRDGSVREQFAMHCVAVFKLFNQLSEKYGEDLNFFSKTDQVSFEDFPEQKPDAYLTMQAGDETRHYFLDILDEEAHLLVDVSKRIQRYLGYRKSGNWATTGAAFPKVIFVCNSEKDCARVQKRCNAALNKAWVHDVEFIVTTKDTVTLSL